MDHTIIVVLTSAFASIIATLLTLHILIKRDKKRSNKKIKQSYIITPLPLKKYQHKAYTISPSELLTDRKKDEISAKK